MQNEHTNTDNFNDNSNLSLDEIASEIRSLFKNVDECFLAIGKRLNEAKALIKHGGWRGWLKNNTGYSLSQAEKLMRIAREYPDPHPVTDLGIAKASVIMALTKDERDNFIEETHDIDGVKKTVVEMSKRELAKAVKVRNEGQKPKPDIEDSPEVTPNENAAIPTPLQSEELTSEHGISSDFNSHFVQAHQCIENMFAALVELKSGDPEAYSQHNIKLRKLCMKILHDLPDPARPDMWDEESVRTDVA